MMTSAPSSPGTKEPKSDKKKKKTSFSAPSTPLATKKAKFTAVVQNTIGGNEVGKASPRKSPTLQPEKIVLRSSSPKRSTNKPEGSPSRSGGSGSSKTPSKEELSFNKAGVGSASLKESKKDRKRLKSDSEMMDSLRVKVKKRLRKSKSMLSVRQTSGDDVADTNSPIPPPEAILSSSEGKKKKKDKKKKKHKSDAELPEDITEKKKMRKSDPGLASSSKTLKDKRHKDKRQSAPEYLSKNAPMDSDVESGVYDYSDSNAQFTKQKEAKMDDSKSSKSKESKGKSKQTSAAEGTFQTSTDQSKSKKRSSKSLISTTNDEDEIKKKKAKKTDEKKEEEAKDKSKKRKSGDVESERPKRKKTRQSLTNSENGATASSSKSAKGKQRLSRSPAKSSNSVSTNAKNANYVEKKGNSSKTKGSGISIPIPGQVPPKPPSWDKLKDIYLDKIQDPKDKSPSTNGVPLFCDVASDKRMMMKQITKYVASETPTFTNGPFNQIEESKVDEACEKYLRETGLSRSDLPLLVAPRQRAKEHKEFHAKVHLYAGLNRSRFALHHYLKRKYTVAENSGKWTAEEDAELERLRMIHSDNWVKIEELMSRKGARERAALLGSEFPAKKWDKTQETSFIAAVHSLYGEMSPEKVVNADIDFGKVAKKFTQKSEKALKTKWTRQNGKSLYLSKYSDKNASIWDSKDSMVLLDSIAKTNFTTPKDIKWIKVAEIFGETRKTKSFGSNRLHDRWKLLLRQVPENLRSSFKETRKYLEETCMDRASYRKPGPKKKKAGSKGMAVESNLSTEVVNTEDEMSD